MKITNKASSGAPALHYVKKWRKLARAAQVEVYRNGQVVAAGRVDVITGAGDLLWLFQENGLGRVLFHKDDGVDVFERPQHTLQEPTKAAAGAGVG